MTSVLQARDSTRQQQTLSTVVQSALGMAEGELAVPLLGDDQEAEQGQQQATRSAEADASPQGDLEQGLSGAGSDAGDAHNTAEDEAAYEVW